MRALLSISDKEGIVEFAKELENLGFELLPTDGTYRLLKENDLNVVEVNELTNSPKFFESRVKTLHPKIHGGILHKRKGENHRKQAKDNGILGIDLVCVNLYPLKETTIMNDDFGEIIENIDIGGPAMIRNVAKNYKDVLVVCDVAAYQSVIEALKNGKNDENFHLNLMIKAYEHTVSHDSYIVDYMNERSNGDFGEHELIVGQRTFNTKYGENPHQKGVLYEFDAFFSTHFRALRGEMNFNSLTDTNAAASLTANFRKALTMAIIKHGNPCGFALKDSLLKSYVEVLKCDNVSAYGGVVAINGKLGKTLAEKISEIYVELIITANVDEEALAIFETKKRVKIFTQESPCLLKNCDEFDSKHIDGGFIYQNSDEIREDEFLEAKCVSEKCASKDGLKGLEIALRVAALTESNNVAYVKNGALATIGMGMTSRVDAAKTTIHKAYEMGFDLREHVLVSEAFFPFRDSIDETAKVDMKAIVQPGGSIRDDEVIKATDEYGVTLYSTGVRHFLH